MGNHLAKLLKNEDSELIALVRLDSSLDHKELFLRVYDNLDLLLSAEPDFSEIFDVASFIPYGKENQQDLEFVRTNILQTARLVIAYTGSRFVYSSSVSIYGDPRSVPLTVESPFVNPNLYGLSKLAGETSVRNHPNHAIIRFSSIIGPRMKTSSFIPKIIEKAKATGKIHVFGDGLRLQNYIDVRDAASLCLKCASFGNNVITLGISDKSHSNKEVARLIAEITGAQIEYTGTDRSASFEYDTQGIHDLLGFHPVYSLRQSIIDMIK